MLDRDLAELYEVETKTLNQAVKRNISRFPDDFMFQLTHAEDEFSRSQFVTLNEEENNLKSQFVTSRSKSPEDKPNLKFQFGTSSYGGRRKLPYAFTEQGVAMLSSVLRSETAILVNIQIMRTFTKLRELLSSNKELLEKVEQMESRYDSQFQIVFEAIKQLVQPSETPPEEPKPRIGFRTD